MRSAKVPQRFLKGSSAFLWKALLKQEEQFQGWRTSRLDSSLASESFKSGIANVENAKRPASPWSISIKDYFKLPPLRYQKVRAVPVEPLIEQRSYTLRL